MKTLGHLLGSAARVDILRALYLQSRPVGLRQVARIAGVLPRSADSALRQLVDEKLVFCNAAAARSAYRLNRKHSDAPMLDAIFKAETQQRLMEKSKTLNSTAQQILPFIKETTEMLTLAKRSRA